jgi:hypothetical protein
VKCTIPLHEILEAALEDGWEPCPGATRTYRLADAEADDQADVDRFLFGED